MIVDNKYVKFLSEDLQELVIKYQNPDITEKEKNILFDKIFEMTELFGISIMRKYERIISVDDLLRDRLKNAYVESLMRALNGYKPQKEVKFSSYLYKTVSRLFSREISSSLYWVGDKLSMMNQRMRISKFMKIYTKENGIPPDDSAIMKKFNLTQTQYELLYLNRNHSLNVAISNDQNEPDSELGELIPDDHSGDFVEKICESDSLAYITKLIVSRGRPHRRLRDYSTILPKYLKKFEQITDLTPENLQKEVINNSENRPYIQILKSFHGWLIEYGYELPISKINNDLIKSKFITDMQNIFNSVRENPSVLSLAWLGRTGQLIEGEIVSFQFLASIFDFSRQRFADYYQKVMSGIKYGERNYKNFLKGCYDEKIALARKQLETSEKNFISSNNPEDILW